MGKMVIGNLKMNILSVSEREQYISNLKKELGKKEFSKTEIVVCPPFVHLESFGKNIGQKVKLGAQNMFPQREGSFTGEISPAMLKNIGCEYVILGHSERRKYFDETDKEINLKVVEALKIGLKPVVCVGETKAEKEANQILRVLTKQIKEVLAGISRTKAEQITIAYEPVWAVGTDIVPTSNEIMEAKLLIKKILISIFDKKYAGMTKILYGGSVNSKTVLEVCVDPAMDGVLIGRESLIPYEFVKIAEIINN
ncbi:MAG TPA: triose-phosphate isomerase [Candidatus Moranbacteria bacterium]|nr:triose-phosphate isomerase [Candidatus Moranbacteria bacterium]